MFRSRSALLRAESPFSPFVCSHDVQIAASLSSPSNDVSNENHSDQGNQRNSNSDGNDVSRDVRITVFGCRKFVMIRLAYSKSFKLDFGDVNDSICEIELRW